MHIWDFSRACEAFFWINRWELWLNWPSQLPRWQIASVLQLSLPNVKAPWYLPDLAILERRETAGVKIYSRSCLYRTWDITNPRYIKQFFTVLDLICLKKVCIYRTSSISDQFYFPWVFDIVGSDCNTVLWLLKIVGTKLHRKSFDTDSVIKVTFMCLSKIMKISWLEHFIVQEMSLEIFVIVWPTG